MWRSEYAARAASFLQVVELWPMENQAFRTGWPKKRMTPAEAYEAWTSWEAMNIGFVAWPRWWVLDLDGPEAVEWFAALCELHGCDAEKLTLTVLTPGRGGGRHLIMDMPALGEGARLRAWLLGCREAEVKCGPGRQTALPPSVRAEGAYRFMENGFTSPQPTPDWLLPSLLRPARGAVVECDPEAVRLGELIECPGMWGELGQALLDGYVDEVKGAREGERNDTLFWNAVALADLGAVEEQFDALGEAAKSAGLSEREVERTIESAQERGWR